VRRLILPASILALLLACASIGAPPGGPPDKEPPALLSVQPESGAVTVRAEEVSFHFDDVINEGGGGTSGGLGQLFVISPRDGEVKVAWHRSTLDVRPDDGFRSNTAYTITMLPGIADLRGNRRNDGASIVFSTGPTIPPTRIAGTLFDWVAGTPAPNGAVEVFPQADTQTAYVARADSLGRFVVAHMPPGSYTVRAFLDGNDNQTLDRREAWDTTHVALRDSARVELLAFVHDTIGPSIASLTRVDSLTLRVTFDQGIDTAQTIDTTLFQLLTTDSTRVPIARARPAAQWEEAQARADSIALADSLARADSIAGRADSVARQDSLAARTDTTRRAALPKPSRPSPVKSVVLELGAPLMPGKSYRLTATGVRGLLGATHPSTRTIDVPAAPPPVAADTTRPPPDTTAGRYP
jgi:hypothetical protein